MTRRNRQLGDRLTILSDNGLRERDDVVLGCIALHVVEDGVETKRFLETADASGLSVRAS